MIAFYVMLLVSIGVIILFILPYQETEVEIFDHQMIISGIYSETLSIDQIDKAEFLQYYPPVKLKTNGFALTNLKKGWFKLESGEKVKLFINDMSGPFLKIYTNQNYSVIIGLKNVDEELLYRQIKLLKK